jgi:hypothetical protein
VGDFVPIPVYDDYQARATLALRKDEELSANFLGSDDKLRRTIPSDDPAERRVENTDTSYWRVMVRYARLMPDGASVLVTPSLGFDKSRSLSLFGKVPGGGGSGHRAIRPARLLRGKVGPRTTLSLGLDFAGRGITASRNGSVNLPAREGDVAVFGQPPGDDIAADSWTVNLLSAAPYVAAELVVGGLTLTPGLRFGALHHRRQPHHPAVR